MAEYTLITIMAELPDGLLAGSIRHQCDPAATRQERTDAAEFLFVVAEALIKATGPHEENFRIPYRGDTPFYQSGCSEVLLVHRLATDELALLPYFDLASSTPRTEYIQLAVDHRRQHKRNKLPVPIAFGRIALSPICYKDKVLRFIRTDGRDEDQGADAALRNRSDIHRDKNLLMSNLCYGQVPECSAAGTELITAAHNIESVSRMLGAHQVVADAAKTALA